jgi:ferric-dicitrate binding protein FerR (iron transport regulator)
MPYADPERQREAVRQWQESHPEKLKAYRKTMFMKRAIEKRRFPQPSSIQQHAITEDEVIQLVEGVLASLRACAPSEQVL